MPTFDDNMEEFESVAGGFGFSGVKVDELDESEYTLAGITLDNTPSIRKFAHLIEKTVAISVRGCRDAPRADNLLFRLTKFNSTVEEVHGWKPLSQIDEDNDYQNIMSPDYYTALFDAADEMLESTKVYAQEMKKPPNFYSANAVSIFVTDGDDNDSKRVLTPEAVGQKIEEIEQSESLESLITILVAVNVKNAHCKQRLQEFKDKAGLTKYIEIEDFNEKTMAKLAEFISSSVSDTADLHGTGDSLKEDDLNIAI